MMITIVDAKNVAVLMRLYYHEPLVCFWRDGFFSLCFGGLFKKNIDNSSVVDSILLLCSIGW